MNAPLAIVRKPVADLKADPNNARKHSERNLTAIRASLERFGQRAPLIVRPDGSVVAGNGTLSQIRAMGWTHVDVVVFEGTDEEATALALAMNRTAELAEWDDEVLAKTLQGMDESLRAAAGWLGDELGRVCDELMPTVDSEAPPVQAKAISRSGDQWILGRHRVRCGDSTSSADVTALMGGGSIVADLVVTDPPYGVAVASRIGTNTKGSAEARAEGGQQIANDNLDLDQLRTFLRGAFAQALRCTRPGASWYVFAPHGPIGLAFSETLTEIDVWRHSLVWVKDSLVIGRADYHYRHEPIYYGWTPGAGHRQVEDRTQTTVWEFPRPKRSEEHPTMKPVELVANAILNSSVQGETVLDLFLGSGTTLIACEQHGRTCCGMELSPNYVDVIIRRWQEATGQDAKLEVDGRTFASVELERGGAA